MKRTARMLASLACLVSSGAQAHPSQGRDFSAAIEALCGPTEPGLERAAYALAHAGTRALTPADVIEELRVARAPYVWPRAFERNALPSERAETLVRVKAWASSFDEGGERRCGAAVRRLSSGAERVVVIAVDALAELRELPSRVREGAWVDVEAELLVPSEGAKVVVLGPRGRPRSVPTSFFEARVRARFAADAPGLWLVQVLADVAGGPRPVLEARVFAGVARERLPSPVPGEPSGAGREPVSALEALIAAARRSENLPMLRRSPALDALAREHAARMLRERRVAHDVGEGSPVDRVGQAGLSVASVGENVAHASNALLAQRALWSSPSHRANLLSPYFDIVGIGVATDRDGTLWVCELFARQEGP